MGDRRSTSRAVIVRRVETESDKLSRLSASLWTRVCPVTLFQECSFICILLLTSSLFTLPVARTRVV